MPFGDAPLTVVNVRGRPAWFASEIGRALGYDKEGARLGELVTNEWAADFTAGTDFEILKNGDLRNLRNLLQHAADNSATREYRVANVSPKARAVMVLFESAVDGVALKTDRPAGVQLRRWLRDEVLPKLRRGEGVQPDAAPAAPEAQPAPLDGDEASDVARRALFRLMEIARGAGALDANGKLSMTDGADMNLPVRQAPPAQAAPAGLDPRDLEIAKLRAELAEAREALEHAKVVAMRTKARTDKRIAVLADAAADANVSRIMAARSAEELRSLKEKAADAVKNGKALLAQLHASRAEYQAVFLDYKLMGAIRISEWWSPTRIASLLGEDVTAEEVGRVINQIPSLRRRGDIEGICRSVPYTFRHGGVPREGVRYEYSKTALSWIINVFHGLPLDGE